MSIEIERLEVGVLGTNCYIVHNNANECLIIDPGDDADKIASEVRALGLVPKAVLLTHGHWDHFGAASRLSQVFGIEVYVHKLDAEFVRDPFKCTFRDFDWLKDFALEPDAQFEEGRLRIASFEFEVIHLPGHSKGSSSFYFPDEGVIFTGDTLFRNAIGRTDLPCSEPEKMEDSLKKLFCLPPETKVFPGHGDETTLAYEIEFNPFINF
jgi:glyoxylase-like metal-dependent hydrolase (beta-lactamase superfamily II)